MKPAQRAPVKQPTSPELTEELLRFIQVKFYPDDPVEFTKDKPRLLRWVVFEFARWLERRGVTLRPARFLEIIRDNVLMEALRHGNTGNIAYRPGYLRMVVQRHLAHHGEEYYEEGKSIRTLAETALLAAQRPNVPAPDPIRDLAQADRLLGQALRQKKRPVDAPIKRQLTLL